MDELDGCCMTLDEQVSLGQGLLHLNTSSNITYINTENTYLGSFTASYAEYNLLQKITSDLNKFLENKCYFWCYQKC